MRKSVTDKAETPIAHRTSSSWFVVLDFALFSHRSGLPWQPARMREEYLQQPLQQLVGSERDRDIPNQPYSLSLASWSSRLILRCC